MFFLLQSLELVEAHKGLAEAIQLSRSHAKKPQFASCFLLRGLELYRFIELIGAHKSLAECLQIAKKSQFSWCFLLRSLELVEADKGLAEAIQLHLGTRHLGDGRLLDTLRHLHGW
jgi:hypothetical protein